MATCARCSGTGKIAAFVDYANRPGEFRDDLSCGDCDGTGSLTPERAAAMEEGERLRKRRVAADLSLRDAAALLGISPAELSRRERGHPPRAPHIGG